VGPADRTVDDPIFAQSVLAFQGNGLRPYAPVFAKLKPSATGQELSWVRRTRIDGDPWADLDVPLGEETEQYIIQVRVGPEVVRVATVSSPNWNYSEAMMDDDLVLGDFEVSIAQVSERFGPGPSAVIGGRR
ncbi:MAG: hypothetical protein AAGH17_01485, partial [Pseudomonadota bacterium]